MQPGRGAETVCLVTTGQPSTNPRLVKEADALTGAGYRVHVVGAYCAGWAIPFDRALVESRSWRFTWIDWRASSSPYLFWKTRLRHHAAKALTRVPAAGRVVWKAALARSTPELVREASRVPADLYIAHNLGALPAAIDAARRCGVPVGFDAEDFHSGELSSGSDVSRRAFVEWVERRLLRECTYVTAATPGVADAYGKLAGIERPTTVLNVFPLSERPDTFVVRDAREPVRLYWFSQTIGRGRGLEDAVRAMGQLRDWPLELHLRGAWQAGYRDELLQLADSVGVRREQIVAAAPGAPGDMVRIAAAHDVGLALEQHVSVNRDIALTNKVFVHLLAGLALVATRTRAQAEFAKDLGEAVATYDAGDIGRLSAVLRHWLTDRDALVRARRTAWQLGETRYNWDNEKEVFLAVVRQALSECRAPGRDPCAARKAGV